jgi:hypothetical protein
MKRVLYLLIVNVTAVLFLTVAVVTAQLQLYPAGVMAYLALLVADGLILFRAAGKRSSAIGARAVPRSLWLVAALFTPPGIAAIVAFARNPDLTLGVQAGAAVLLVGYIWFLIYRLSGQSQSGSGN